MNPSLARCLLLALLGLGALSGCRSLDPDAAAKFAATTTAVKTQADDSLNAVAALTRDASVNYAAAQDHLAEANFIVVPDGDTIAEWDGAFVTLTAYSQNLAALTSPQAVQNFDAAATNLFDQFQQTATRLNADSIHSQAGVSAALATAFTETADAILRAREQATAVKIARATDTNVTAICRLFADEIGADHTTAPGLRKTLYETVWRPRLAALTSSFLAAKPADRVAICRQYADLLAQREAEDQILAGLRRSLLALADAHHTLAAGQAGSIQADLVVVTAEVQHTHDLYNQYSALAQR